MTLSAISGFDRRCRYSNEIERRQGECDRMRHGESRDRNQQAARRAGDEHEAGDEQQVIDADPDVFHAECNVYCVATA